MNDVLTVYQPGVIAIIEQFTYAVEELRQFVIYTYYNKNEEPLYVGCSKDFYNAHYFNSGRLSFFDEIEYVGFVLCENEINMKESKKYYIRARQPKYGRGKHLTLPYLKGCDIYGDDLVVSTKEMVQRWQEWLSDDDDGFGDQLLADLDAEVEAEIDALAGKVKTIVKIKDRDLTQEEMNYVRQWWEMDIDKQLLQKAYETTVIRTKSFSWSYMNHLLKRWKK